MHIVACRLKAWLNESTRTSITKQRLQLELVSVSAEINTLTTAALETRILEVVTTETEALTVTNTLAVVASENGTEGFKKMFSLQWAKDYLKRMADWAYRQWRVKGKISRQWSVSRE
jgi:hypothetical protein